MDKDLIIGHYLKDAKEHFPSMEIKEVEKDGVPQPYTGDSDDEIKVRTVDKIIIEVVD